jgi:ribosomal protein S18 acetylase RimI-like enzyme
VTDTAIERIDGLTPELVRAISCLIPQLSGSARIPKESELAEIIASPATSLFVARANSTVVGMLTLVLVRIPTGLRGVIEDVVVMESHRRRGIGNALSRAALAHARSAGARTVDLTSRPDREAANGLYRQIGFVLRETNVYRYSFDRGPARDGR